MRSFLSVLGLYFASVTYAAIGHNANVFVGNTVISPDGTPRSAVLAGGTSSDISFPGPLISGQKGDTFNLNVVNQLTDTSMLVSTSIHWHGLFQNGTAWADGPVGVTQCPITPGNSFNYQFQALNQAGTYWYHSHYSTQYCDGLRGAFVLYDPQDPYASQYDVDDESTVITLADWYHTVAPILGAQAGPPQSDAVLINGLGRNVNNATAELAVITVEPGKRYRFRLVSISCDPNFQFSIDSHLMKIIEVDGNNVTPLIVDQIQIFAGQRYSFILVADQTPQTNYWIRALPNIGNTASAGFTNGVNSAILRYSGAPDAEPAVPATVPASKQPMVETALHPLEDPSAPGTKGVGNADVVLPLQINFTSGHFTVNNATFTPPSVPVLLQILSGTKTAQDLLPSGSVYTLPPNSIIEINLPGGTTGSPHPIHLHGHAFSVVRSAGNSTYNYDNPVRRDVVSIGTSLTDNVTIRFKTDNSGPWILHCHIDWHLELGLAVVMAEDVDTIAAHNVPPSAWDQLCPTYNALPTQTFN